MKESYYFRHFADSRQDPKIIRLLMKHKMEGYGIFWSLLEILRTSKDYKIIYDPEAIAYQLNNNSQTISDICENFHLFKIEGGFIWSEPFSDFLTTRSKTYQNNRYSKDKKRQLSINSQSTDRLTVDIKESKVKESKIHTGQNTPSLKTIFKPPTITEVKAYCQERNNNVNPEHFCAYYDSIGWMRGKNKMKNWKATIVTWENNNKDNHGITWSKPC